VANAHVKKRPKACRPCARRRLPKYTWHGCRGEQERAVARLRRGTAGGL